MLDSISSASLLSAPRTARVARPKSGGLLAARVLILTALCGCTDPQSAEEPTAAAVLGVPPSYAESVAVVAMAPDGSRELGIRLGRFPAEERGTLWLSVFDGERRFAVSDTQLDLGRTPGATPVDKAAVAFEVAGESQSLFFTDGRNGGAMRGHVVARSLTHESYHPPAERGTLPVEIELDFEATHEGVRVRDGRWEVFGRVQARVTTPDGTFELDAPGKWHEQIGDRPNFAPAFVYFSVQGDGIALLARGGSGTPWGFLLEGEEISLVEAFTIDPNGEEERSFEITLDDGRTLDGVATVLRQSSVPIEGQRRPGATVRVEWSLGPMVGHLNDWNPRNRATHSYELESSYLRWPVASEDETYTRLDGDRIKIWVEEMAAISRRSRESGDRYWGRIAGAASDQATETWIVEQFQKLGMSDVHEQPFVLAPQWFPLAWSAALTGETTTVDLPTAHPAKGSPATPEGGLDLEAIWLGLGTAADFLGRDVRGKAVFLYSIPTPSVIRHSAQWNGAAQRADEAGAAAVFIALGIPGDFTTQLNSTYGADVPTFSLSFEDGDQVRRRIEESGAAQVHVDLTTEIREGLECANLWGSLPATTDENIMIIAHHDGYFEGALDNASGTAVMLGLAEYFAAQPAESRRRTLHFVSTAGHHAGSMGTRWMHENRATALADTVLMINSEHVSVTQTYYWGPRLRKSNTVDARRWWVHGSQRLRDIVLGAYSDFGVAVYHEMEPIASGDMSSVCRDLPTVQIIESPAFYHSDHDIPEFVPPVGLEAMARAYAKVITEVDDLERSLLLPTLD